jgi:protein SCO1
MKSSLILALSFLAGAPLSAADQAAAAPCCPVLPAAKPACCAEEIPSIAKPLTNRSIYQLDAKWTNDAGKTVILASLRGRPVVVAMFFAQCEYACPVLVRDIQRLREALPEAVRERTELVLVTVDTERDTPEALRAFRTRMSLDQHWTLLRADADAVQELAMLLGVKFKRDARGQYAHSNLLTLLNAEGEIVHQHGGLNGDISEAARVLATTK